MFSRAALRLAAPCLERRIGVIYKPETERWSHYVAARIREQFDAVVHIDETSAVEPLELTSMWERGELPKTYRLRSDERGGRHLSHGDVLVEPFASMKAARNLERLSL